MADLQEVREAVDVVRATRERLGFRAPLNEVLTILHCTSNYPAAVDDVNLRAMQTISAATGMAVGYSDHTAGVAISAAAVALGATVIEKHFTLDKNLPGPDHKASLEPEELALMIQHIRDIERALGSGEKEPMPKELPVRELVRRSVTTVVPVKKGEVLSSAHIALLRPGTGIVPKDMAQAIGKKAARDLEAGTTLTWNDLA